MDNTVFAHEGAAAGRAYVEYVRAFIDAAMDVEGEPVPEKEVYNRAFLASYQHILDLAVDKYGVIKDAGAGGEDAEGGQCARCWCNTCAKLEDCASFPASDGITPPPCAACENEPIRPRTARPCADYKDIPDDIPAECRKCWCKSCATFEDCVVEKDGYDPASEPCPCDDCGKGQRWMPKEAPPTCGKYQPQAVE